MSLKKILIVEDQYENLEKLMFAAQEIRDRMNSNYAICGILAAKNAKDDINFKKDDISQGIKYGNEEGKKNAEKEHNILQNIDTATNDQELKDALEKIKEDTCIIADVKIESFFCEVDDYRGSETVNSYSNLINKKEIRVTIFFYSTTRLYKDLIKIIDDTIVSSGQLDGIELNMMSTQENNNVSFTLVLKALDAYYGKPITPAILHLLGELNKGSLNESDFKGIIQSKEFVRDPTAFLLCDILKEQGYLYDIQKNIKPLFTLEASCSIRRGGN